MLRNPTNVYPFNNAISLDNDPTFSFTHNGSELKYLILNIYDTLDNSLIAQYHAPNFLNLTDNSLGIKDGEEYTMTISDLSERLTVGKSYKYNYTLYQCGEFYPSVTTDFKSYNVTPSGFTWKTTNSYPYEIVLKKAIDDCHYTINVAEWLSKGMGNAPTETIYLGSVAITVTLKPGNPYTVTLTAPTTITIYCKESYHTTRRPTTNIKDTAYDILYTNTYVASTVDEEMIIQTPSGSLLSSRRFIPAYSGLNIPNFKYDYSGRKVGGMAAVINDTNIGFIEYYTPYENSDSEYYMKFISPISKIPKTGDRVSLYKNYIETPMYGFSVVSTSDLSINSSNDKGVINCEAKYTINNADASENLKTHKWELSKSQSIINSFQIPSIHKATCKSEINTLIISPDNFEAGLLNPSSGNVFAKSGYYTTEYTTISDAIKKGVKYIHFNQSIYSACLYDQSKNPIGMINKCEVTGTTALANFTLYNDAYYIRICKQTEDLSTTNLTMTWDNRDDNLSIDNLLSSTTIPVSEDDGKYTFAQTASGWINNGYYLMINGDARRIKSVKQSYVHRQYVYKNLGKERTIYLHDCTRVQIYLGELSINLSAGTDTGTTVEDDNYGSITVYNTGKVVFKVNDKSKDIILRLAYAVWYLETDKFIIPPQIGDTAYVFSNKLETLYSTDILYNKSLSETIPKLFMPTNIPHILSFEAVDNNNKTLYVCQEINYRNDFASTDDSAFTIIVNSDNVVQINFASSFKGCVYKTELLSPNVNQKVIYYDLDNPTNTIYDYSATTGTWMYWIYKYSSSSSCLLYTQAISCNFETWDIYSLELQQEKYLFGKDLYNYGEHWTLEYNLSEGSIVQNQDIEIHSSLSKYPLKTVGKNNYVSGSLSALIGKIDSISEDYSDTLSNLTAWNEFITNNEIFLLKSPKGEVWIVTVSDNVTRNNEYVGSDILTTVSFNYTQVDDINNVIII